MTLNFVGMTLNFVAVAPEFVGHLVPPALADLLALCERLFQFFFNHTATPATIRSNGHHTVSLLRSGSFSPDRAGNSLLCMTARPANVRPAAITASWFQNGP